MLEFGCFLLSTRWIWVMHIDPKEDEKNEPNKTDWNWNFYLLMLLQCTWRTHTRDEEKPMCNKHIHTLNVYSYKLSQYPYLKCDFIMLCVFLFSGFYYSVLMGMLKQQEIFLVIIIAIQFQILIGCFLSICFRFDVFYAIFFGKFLTYAYVKHLEFHYRVVTMLQICMTQSEALRNA